MKRFLWWSGNTCAGRGLGLALLIALFALAPGSAAQLVWSATEIQVEQDSAGRPLSGRFEFINEGTYPLNIRSVESETVEARARLASSRKTIRPGDSGSVIVNFSNRLLFEPKRVRIKIVTDEARSVIPTVLRFEVVPQGWSELDEAAKAQLKSEGLRIASLPSPLLVENKRFVAAWRVAPGLLPEGEKVVRMQFASEVEGRLLGLTPLWGDTEFFETTVVAGSGPRDYKIHIKPIARELGSAPSENKRRFLEAAWRFETTLSDDFTKRLQSTQGGVFRALVFPVFSLKTPSTPRGKQ